MPRTKLALAPFGEVNGDSFDRFTFAHAGAGILLGALGASFASTAVVAVGWELAEHELKEIFPQAFPRLNHERMGNVVVDSLAVLGGWWLARQLRG